MSDSRTPKEMMLSAKGQADPRDRRTRQEVPFAGNAAFSPRGAGVGSCAPASSAASQAPPQMGLSAGDGPRCSEQLPEPRGCCQGKERYVKRGSVSFLWERADNTADTITFTVPTCGSTPHRCLKEPFEYSGAAISAQGDSECF